MGNKISFSGYSIFYVKQIIKLEYHEAKKSWFSKKEKINIITPSDTTESAYIVAENRDYALEKYKERYKVRNVGDSMLRSIPYRMDEVECTVISVDFKVYYKSLTDEQARKNLSIDDYVKYMVFLKKGFDEILNIRFTTKEPYDE